MSEKRVSEQNTKCKYCFLLDAPLGISSIKARELFELLQHRKTNSKETFLIRAFQIGYNYCADNIQKKIENKVPK